MSQPFRLLALSTSLAGTLSGSGVVQLIDMDIDRHLKSCLTTDSSLAVAVVWGVILIVQ